VTIEDRGPEPVPPAVSPGVLGRLRRLAIDVTPLRESRDFRLLWIGQAVSFIGSMITTVALPYQVFQITGSSLAVGLLGVTELVPLVMLSFVGGALADARDRRRLLLVTNLALALCSLALAATALSSAPPLWILYSLSALSAGLFAIDAPALRSLPPRLVARSQIPAAAALTSAYTNLGALAGPAAGGVLIAAVGLPITYCIDAASFVVAIAALGAMRPVPPAADAAPAGMDSIREGLRFLRRRPVLQSTFLVDLNAMIFGMPRALFPALGSGLGGGARVVGLLYAAPYAGALVGTLLSGWVGRVRRQGLVVMVSVAAWGLAITAFGFARSLWLVLLLLALAGAADLVSAVFRSTILQTVTPDALRGRLSAVELVVVASGPLIGDAEAGIVAAIAGSVRFSIVSGGLACLAGVAVLAAAVPSFWRYDARHPSP
jgi:MFS family permease